MPKTGIDLSTNLGRIQIQIQDSRPRRGPKPFPVPNCRSFGPPPAAPRWNSLHQLFRRHALGGGVALLPPGHGRLQSAAGHAVVIVAWPAQGAGDDRPRRSCSLLENLRRQSYKLELSGGKTGIGNRRNVIRNTTARFYSVDYIGTTVQRLTEQASRRGGGS